MVSDLPRGAGTGRRGRWDPAVAGTGQPRGQFWGPGLSRRGRCWDLGSVDHRRPAPSLRAAPEPPWVALRAQPRVSRVVRWPRRGEWLRDSASWACAWGGAVLISPPGVVVVAAFSPGFSKRLGSRLASMTLSPQRKLLLRLAINISIFSSLPPSQDNLPLLIHSSIICTSGCISNNPFSYEAMDGYFFFF